MAPSPPQSRDIFSLPADTQIDSNFSQPLLPTITGGGGPPGGGQPPQGAGGKIDAFSDLVSIARDKTTSKPEPAPPTIFQAPPFNTEAPPPVPYRPPDLDFTDAPPTTSGPAPSGFDNSFGTSPPAGTGSGFGGVGMNMFGDSFTTGGVELPLLLLELILGCLLIKNTILTLLHVHVHVHTFVEL